MRSQSPDARLAGVLHGVAYSGYRPGQHPDRGGSGEIAPTAPQVLEDLRLLVDTGRFDAIRLYDAGAFSRRVLATIADEALPLKVLLGAWLEAEVSNHEGCPWLHRPIPDDVLAANRAWNAAEVDRACTLAEAYPDVVVALNVGNEARVAWNDHMVPLDALMAHVDRVRSAVDQPVSTADNYVPWVEEAAALGQLDFAMVHTYPQWEGRTVDEALAFSLENLAAVREALPHLPMVVGEAGWASEATEFGARANEDDQARYVAELRDWAEGARVPVFLFEAFDEPWKGDPGEPGGAEKHWGLFDVERGPKRWLRG